jgi:1-deoxy-D-xylulose-5-phosphate reductoisomerase
MATLRAGKRLALANKESLIAAGPVVQPLAVGAGRRAGAGRLGALRRPPVPAGQPGYEREIDRLILTASGGPFRGRTAPTGPGSPWQTPWSTRLEHGPKITIDSSTLMNKASR